MSHNNIEIEIQVNVQKVKPLLDFLKNKGKFKYSHQQIDEYFTPPNRNFLAIRPVKEWLRLRESGGKYSIAYKNWHYDKKGRGRFADEYETEVKSLSEVRKIFIALNFKSLTVVNKLRKTWDYKNYEIAIDTVKNLGNFVEVEYIGKSKKVNAKKISKEMIMFLKKLGCGKILRNNGGYPYLLLFPQDAKYEEL